MPKMGDCFQAAGHLIMELSEDALLCYGTVYSTALKKEIIHAWVEINGWVLDFSNGRRIGTRIEKYYAIGQAKNVMKFPKILALKLMVKVGTFGEWTAKEIRLATEEYDKEIKKKVAILNSKARYRRQQVIYIEQTRISKNL